MTTLSIQFDDRTTKRLRELSRREHTKPEALVADAVRRRLFIDWLEDTNDKLSRRAKQSGLETEDDFLNAVS